MDRINLPLLCAFSLGCPDYNVERFGDADTFKQGAAEPPIDILWVIDNSKTMGEEQDLVSVHMSAFAEMLVLGGVDYQIGVLTTDVDAEGGQIVGDILTPGTPDLANALTLQASVGTEGGRYERPLEAVRLATTAPLIDDAHDGLIREGARLEVIILTDEDDQSEDSLGTYQDHLQGLKAGAYRISAIAGALPEGCASHIAQAEPAERLIEAIEATDGDFHSICQEDFEPVLTSLALNAAGLTDRFILSNFPAPDTIEVHVDSALIPNRDHDGWLYDPGDNAIVFSGYAVPRAGQEITVEYLDLVGSEQLDQGEDE